MAFSPSGIRQADMERLKLARNMRRQQLVEWTNREKELEDQGDKKYRDKNLNKVKFEPGLIFMEAAQRNDVEETRLMLESGVDPDTVNEDGLSALHQASINNSYPIAKLLVNFNANINARDSELWTPLHAAATCGHKKICQFLISKGADVLAINIDGNMPYDICDDDDTLDVIESEMGKQNISQEDIDEKRKVPELEMLHDIQELVSRNCSLNKLDWQGAAPLHIACCLGYEDVARFVLESGADPDLPDGEGWLPTHIAVCWCQWDILELLIMHGADLEAKSADQKNVFSICDSAENTQKLQEIWSKRDYLKSLARSPEPVGFQRNNRNSNRRRSISSVKRSSLREKNDISRRATKEEARYVFEKPEQEQDSSIPVNGTQTATSLIPPLGKESSSDSEVISPPYDHSYSNGIPGTFSPPMHIKPGHQSLGQRRANNPIRVISPQNSSRSHPDSIKAETEIRIIQSKDDNSSNANGIPISPSATNGKVARSPSSDNSMPCRPSAMNPVQEIENSNSISRAGTLSSTSRIPIQTSITPIPRRDSLLKLKTPDGVVLNPNSRPSTMGADAFDQESYEPRKSDRCCVIL